MSFYFHRYFNWEAFYSTESPTLYNWMFKYAWCYFFPLVCTASRRHWWFRLIMCEDPFVSVQDILVTKNVCSVRSIVSLGLIIFGYYIFFRFAEDFSRTATLSHFHVSGNIKKRHPFFTFFIRWKITELLTHRFKVMYLAAL